MDVMQSQARAATDKAARYMIQLAKHWSHKFEVSFDDHNASIALPAGLCTMQAEPEVLVVKVEAQDLESLARMETVVADHLNRFAFREPELSFAWTRTGAG